MFHWKTIDQFKKWNDRHEKLKAEKGYGLELYFMDEDGSIRYEEALEAISTAINNDLDWLESEVDITNLTHPYL